MGPERVLEVTMDERGSASRHDRAGDTDVLPALKCFEDV